jgi:hypothetical protein
MVGKDINYLAFMDRKSMVDTDRIADPACCRLG